MEFLIRPQCIQLELFDGIPHISHKIELLNRVITKISRKTDRTEDGTKILLPEGSEGTVIDIDKGELNDIYYIEFLNNKGYSIAIEPFYSKEIIKID